MGVHHVDLTDQDEAFLDGAVASGRFVDADAAFAEGLRLLVEDDARTAAFVERIVEAHQRMQNGEFPAGMDDETARRAFRALRREWEAWEGMFAPNRPEDEDEARRGGHGRA